MARVKLGSKHQITLPAKTVRRLGLAIGEELEVVEQEKAITLIPRKHIAKDQEWYYTEEWQKGMQESFEDLKAGRIAGPFKTAEEAINNLRS